MVRRVVGKLKLFPDSEWKHFVAAPAAPTVLLEFLRLPRHTHRASRGIRFLETDVRANLKLER